MRLALITGTLTATVKSPQLGGQKFLLADVVDAAGKVLQSALVLADDVGAGVGDRVLIVEGSAARLPSGAAGLPVDATAVAIVDEITSTNPASRRG